VRYQLPEPQFAPAQAQTIDLLRAEIAGVKQEIGDLTSQLTNGTSDAREEAVTAQIDRATERLQTLQASLDARIRGDEVSVATSFPDMPPPIEPINVTQVSAWLFSTVAVTVLLLPIIRSWMRRSELRVRPPAAPDDVRLDRIEQAIDALAVEMERVSEGQRYSARVLNELRALPAPPAEPFGRQEHDAVPVRRTADTPA
jgi:hypothetical protein